MDTDNIILFPLSVFVVLLCLAGFLMEPHYEARYYKLRTGIEVSYWEAFWMELDSPIYNKALHPTQTARTFPENGQ